MNSTFEVNQLISSTHESEGQIYDPSKRVSIRKDLERMKENQAWLICSVDVPLLHFLMKLSLKTTGDRVVPLFSLMKWTWTEHKISQATTYDLTFLPYTDANKLWKIDAVVSRVNSFFFSVLEPKRIFKFVAVKKFLSLLGMTSTIVSPT